MAETNEFKVVGTIFSIDVATRKGKQDPNITYKVHTLLIENNRSAERSYENKKGDKKSSYGKKTEWVKIEFFNNVLVDSFAVEDFVEISGYLSGQEWVTPEGVTKIITKNAGQYIKHADMDAGHPNHRGKIKVEPKVDPEEAKLNEVFKNAVSNNSFDDESDLPF